MSRGFVKEDDQEEVPIVPQRAYLPEGVTKAVYHSLFLVSPLHIFFKHGVPLSFHGVPRSYSALVTQPLSQP